MPPDTSDEDVALVALLRDRPGGMTWPELTAEVVDAGSARAVRAAIGSEQLSLLPDEGDSTADATHEVAGWLARGDRFVTVLDPEYPARLRAIHEAPPILFYRGRLLPDDIAVSVVGSRSASAAGRAFAGEVATALVGRGVTVLSGLALGVDAAAHEAALDAGGRTVAVLGTGINRIYPAAHRELHDRIARSGLLLSQFWPDAPPQKHTFLMRNATMSGYGRATVVVEAGEHSGARAQARMAVAHGRPVVLTEAVLRANDWARALEGRPGVSVAGTPADVLDIVGHLIDRERATAIELRELLAQ